MISAIKIIDLDTEVFTDKNILTFVFEINDSSIYTIVLFQIIILGFDIWYLIIVVFLLGYCLINIVYKNKYSYIFYYEL